MGQELTEEESKLTKEVSDRGSNRDNKKEGWCRQKA